MDDDMRRDGYWVTQDGPKKLDDMTKEELIEAVLFLIKRQKETSETVHKVCDIIARRNARS